MSGFRKANVREERHGRALRTGINHSFPCWVALSLNLSETRVDTAYSNITELLGMRESSCIIVPGMLICMQSVLRCLVRKLWRGLGLRVSGLRIGDEESTRRLGICLLLLCVAFPRATMAKRLYLQIWLAMQIIVTGTQYKFPSPTLTVCVCKVDMSALMLFMRHVSWDHLHYRWVWTGFVCNLALSLPNRYDYTCAPASHLAHDGLFYHKCS